MDTRKYEIIRNRLDALDYKFPFSSESIPLIEAMLSDLSSLHSSLQKLRAGSSQVFSMQHLDSQGKSRSEAQTGQLSLSKDYDKEALLRIIQDLRGENKLLTTKLAAIPTGRVSSFDPTVNDYTQSLFQETQNLRKTQEDLKDLNQRLSIENENLIEKNRILESQIFNLKQDLQLSGHTIKEISYENKSTTEEFFILRQNLSSQESKNIMLQNEVNRLRIELQRSVQQSKNYESSLSESQKEIIRIQSEVELSNSYKARANNSIEGLNRQVEVLTNENNKLHSLRDEERKNSAELERKLEETQGELAASYEKMRGMMKENQNFNESLRAKCDETRSKEGQIRVYEKEVENYRVYVKKYEDTAEEVKRLKEQIENLAYESKKVQQELNEAKGQLRYKEEDSRQLKVYLEQANKDIDHLKRSLQEESFKSESINTMKRNADFLEDQIKLIKTQFEESLSRERQLHKEVETTRLVLSKTEEKLNQASKQSEFSLSSKLSIEKENSKLQKNLSEALQRENFKNIEIAKLENKTQTLAGQLEDFKIALMKSQDEGCSIGQELRDCQQMFEAEKVHVMRLNDQTSQLKAFIATLEENRNEQVNKIEYLQAEALDKDNLVKRLREELNQARKQLMMSEKICADGVQSQESLVQQIEKLKYEVARRSDETCSLKNSIKNYMNEAEDLKCRIKVLNECEEMMKRSLRELEIEKSRFEDQARSLIFQNDENQKNLYRVQCQMNDLNKDLADVARENKRYEEKIREFESNEQNLYSKLEELSKDNKAKQEIIVRLGREIEDLTVKYKNTVDNLDKMTRSYDYLNLDFKKISSKAVAAESSSENWKKQEEIWIRNRNELEEEVRRVIRNAEISDLKRLEAEKAYDELKRETQQQRLMVRDMDYTNEEMGRRLNSVENERMFYESRLKTAENEIVSLKNQVEIEKRRNEEFEIKNARRNEFEDDHRARTYQGNSDLISELYKQIETYKSDSLRLEMDYMKLMDEHSKSKRLLGQADLRISELESNRR